MYVMHPIIEAIYDNVPYTYKGPIVAAHPWTGHYEIDNGLWITAHFTQFFKPGWVYIDNGCSYGSDDSYLTLKNPATNDYGIVILNRGNTTASYTFNLTNLPSTSLKVWISDEGNQFYQDNIINVVGGTFSLTIPPKTIYTLTTTVGQQKGLPAYPIPEATALNLPYTDNFESYAIGKQPKYTVDQSGAFEISDQGKNGGQCLRQVINYSIRPFDWERRATPSPYTILGDQLWKNYKVSFDFYMEPITDLGYEGYVLLGARCNFSPTENVPAECYNIMIYYDGRWQLRRAAIVLTAGIIPNFSLNTWYPLAITIVDANISVYFNNMMLTQYTDTEIPSGHVVIGSGYNFVRYDNFQVSAIDGSTPVSCIRYQVINPKIEYIGAWAESGKDAKNYARTLFVSKNTGNIMEFAFNGMAVSILGNIGLDCGQADIYLDGNFVTTVDAYSDSLKWRKSLFSAYQLAAGDHTLRLVVKGTKNSDSTDTYIKIDAVEITGGTGLIDLVNN